MAESPLNIVPGSGSQQTTPDSSTQATSQVTATQPAGQINTIGTPIGAVQPSTAPILTNNQQGIPLGNLPATTSTTQPDVKPPASHHVQPVFVAIPVLLFIAAGVLFWYMSRSSKKHNQL